MNYIGSKLSLLNFIGDSIDQIIEKKENKAMIFCDLFAGTGAVGVYFKKKGYKIFSNDIQYYSYILNKHYIGNHKELFFKGLLKEIPKLKKTNYAERKSVVCEYLNTIKKEKGFIYNNYCFGGTKNKDIQRNYFSDVNGMKCDAIRKKIESWNSELKITKNEYYFLLTSLLESIDRSANTASVYGAFLKNLKNTALKDMVLKPAPLIINKQSHKVFNKDINVLIKQIKGDVLYLDPPYNNRQYSTNYHILETIAKYDNPKIYGKTGLRDYSKQKSLYCSRVEVKRTFNDLIKKANVKYIFLSYNNEGLMTHDDIKEIMSQRGEYGYFTKNYGRFKADHNNNRKYKADKTIEYLHYVICK